MIFDLRIYTLRYSHSGRPFALMSDPAFADDLARSRALGAHQHQESRIQKSTSFSPL